MWHQSPQAMVHLPWLEENPSVLSGPQSALSLRIFGPKPELPVMKLFFFKKNAQKPLLKNGFPSLFLQKQLVSSTSIVGHIPSKVRSSPTPGDLRDTTFIIHDAKAQAIWHLDAKIHLNQPAKAKLKSRWELSETWTLGVQKLVGFFDVFFFKKHRKKNKKNMFWGESVGRGSFFFGIGKKKIQAMQLFQTTFSSRPNPSRNEDTASFLGHIPGVSELNESTLNLDDFFCASSTKVWRKQLGLRRIELNLPDFWKWWCSLTWRRYKLTTPFQETKCPTQLRSAHNESVTSVGDGC